MNLFFSGMLIYLGQAIYVIIGIVNVALGRCPTWIVRRIHDKLDIGLFFYCTLRFGRM